MEKQEEKLPEILLKQFEVLDKEAELAQLRADYAVLKAKEYRTTIMAQKAQADKEMMIKKNPIYTPTSSN